MACAARQAPATGTVFDRYAPGVRDGLRTLRGIIFDVAEEENAGPLEETLKWGQPSYLTSRTKSGTTIRIDGDKTDDKTFALFVSCNTSLVEGWRERFDGFAFGGNRSVQFRAGDDLARPELRTMIAEALTYHRRKKKKGAAT